MQLIESTKQQRINAFPLIFLVFVQFVWILLHAIDETVVFSLFHLSFSITGLIGLFGAAYIGFYTSTNYINPQSSFFKHLVNTVFFVGYAMVASFIGRGLFVLII